MLTTKEAAREAAERANKQDNMPMADGRWVPVWDVPKGEYCRFVAGGPVWVRSDYDRSSKRFCFFNYYDVNRTTTHKGSKLALIDFTF